MTLFVYTNSKSASSAIGLFCIFINLLFRSLNPLKEFVNWFQNLISMKF